MASQNDNTDVVPLSNPLAQYDPEQPSFIPETFKKTYKRSVYFPKRKACVLYQISQMKNEAARVGTKMTFNDVVIDALELWYKQNKRKHLSWLYRRLMLEHEPESSEVESTSKKQPDNSQLSSQNKKIKEAMAQIEKFFSEQKPTLTTADYELLIVEIVQSLKKCSPVEMSRALAKILARSDISELAAQVRHKPKIEKRKNLSKRGKDEEPEWYE